MRSFGLATRSARLRRGLWIAQLVAFYPPKTGGVERVAQRLAEETSRRHRVEVLTSAVGARPGAECVNHSLTVRRFRSLSVLDTPVFPQVAYALRRLPPSTVIHVHVSHGFVTELGAVAAAVTRWPLVAHYHMEIEPTRGTGDLYRAYKRTVLGPVLRRSSRVVVLSEAQAVYVAQTYRVRPSSISVVPNGVTEEFFARRASRPAAGEPLRLLFVGRLAPQKNLKRLFEAVGRLRMPWELVVVGDGPEAAAGRRWASPFGANRVRFTGAQDNAEVARWMSWAHVLVSSSDNEGMPLVFLEAMAAGLPVVATDVRGSHDTLRDAGVLVRPDAAGLAEGIERLGSDSRLWESVAQAGQMVVQRRTWEATGKLMDEVYAQALAAGPLVA